MTASFYLERFMSMIGRTLGNFECTALLGKGGMGEVYKAKDQKLSRDVAIKVLPEEFAKDADRIARFQREAKLLASLNHPNIASIYGLEESEGTHFLVLELIEGDTLADRIKTGPMLVEDALKLALQIAEALEAAHEKGVIHRDLKPANIKVTPDGKVKVLDFGLAKAFAGGQEDMNLSNSPTLSVAATQQGVILGTAGYMSPEQAKGKPVDKRADIWAFGAVLFEMLTGRQLFTGETASETLASVIKSEPEWSSLPANLNPRIRLLLERCLEKEPRNRYSGISDARVDIQKVLADPSGVFVSAAPAAKLRKKIRLGLPWVAVVAILCLLIAGILGWNLRAPEPPQVTRFEYDVPEARQITSSLGSVLAVSPDGRQFVYSTTTGLYLRSMDELTAKLIAGTQGTARSPFFSPDGKWVGYISQADRQLKKISVNGGAAISLCGVTGAFEGAWWGADNHIVFSQAPGDVMRISANGGTPESLIKAGSALLFYPQVLPDKKSILYSRGPAPRMIVVRLMESGKSKELFPGIYARYFPTGHLVYETANDSNLYAVAFDLDSLEVKGGPVAMVEGEREFESSDSGTLVYIPGMRGAVRGEQRSLVWVDRNGKEESIGAPPKLYRFPNISPDGTKVAVSVVAAGQGHADIWVWDMVRKYLSRITLEGSYNVAPLWTPDGKRIAFLSNRSDDGKPQSGIYWKSADGTGKAEQICSIDPTFLPYGWSDGGKALVGMKMQGFAMQDIEMLPLEEGREPKPLLAQSYNEGQPKISPDGRWIAYTSNESGRNEVYVRSFPDVNRERMQVSTNGGDSPLWSPDGRELFYRNGDATMAVKVETDPALKCGSPGILFRGTYVQASELEGTPWDISPDGKRFLMMKPSHATADESTAEERATAPQTKINVVLNWFEELKERVPVE